MYLFIKSSTLCKRLQILPLAASSVFRKVSLFTPFVGRSGTGNVLALKSRASVYWQIRLQLLVYLLYILKLITATAIGGKRIDEIS